MFATLLRRLVNRFWWLLLIGWVVLAGVLHLVAPAWESVALDGDLDYLPYESPSLVANRLLREAFPDARTKSQAVLIFARSDERLTVEDRQFALDMARKIEQMGPPDMPKLAVEAEPTASEEAGDSEGKSPSGGEGDGELKPLPLVDVWHAKTDVVSRMLDTADGKAELVVARMTNGLMAFDNIQVRDRLLELIAEAKPDKPEGLEVGLTGSTIIGGDVRSAVLDSLESTHNTTIILVLACLIVIYRAPLLVLVPLATIGVSMSVAYDVVALLADNFGPGDFWWSNMRVFTTTKIFVVVILFGAGTDYCLFLIARYKEELQAGVAPTEAAGSALSQVGDALAGSALTTILGLATMIFAQYGKFSSSGPIIAVCLSVALFACVTFAPALLRAIGPRVFWPFVSRATKPDVQEGGSPLWVLLSRLVQRRPIVILCVSAILAAPLVVAGIDVGVTHDLLGELPQDSVSVRGAELIKQHFGEGWVAPVTVIAKQNEGDLHEPRSEFKIARLHDVLYQLEPVADVRSFYLPTGGDPNDRKQRGSIFNLVARAAEGSPLAKDTFISAAPDHDGQVTQLSVVLTTDPFAKASRTVIPEIRQALQEYSQQKEVGREGNKRPNPWYGARFELAGVTPGMHDLEEVTDSDRVRIQVLTVAAVFGVLIVILRRPGVCAYLLLTVLLSYWATIGITELFFGWFYGDTYQGLDWKAPIFLFVILIAVGQDYNIYLTTRVLEEQAVLGRRRGLHRALVATGGIITSCGVIMAGTFISMATGSLRGMVELGFALALGVLLDTFFVRTIVVPCYFAIEARLRSDSGKPPEAASSSEATA
ncbi:MAG: MMPL family transporter [Planctomycetota bacterium]